MHPASQTIAEMGVVSSGSVRVEISRSGEPVFLRNGRYLDSRYNPLREAEKRAAAPELATGRPVVLFGDGGYYLAGLLAGRGLEVVVVEPDPSLAAAVLRSRGPEPLSGFSLVYSSRLQGAGDIGKLLPEPGDAVILEHSPTVQDFPEERERFASLLRESLQRGAAESATTAWFGRRWLFNILSNLGMERYGRLVPQQSGTAVVAVPGPTLPENREWLRRNRNSFCLIALAPALPCLEEMGLKPDLVCATDGGYANLLHFCGCSGYDVPLVFPLFLYRGIRHLWQGPLVPVSYGTDAENRLLPCGRLPVFPESPTVAVFALHLAASLGASRILLAGQDFSVRGLRQHAPGYRFDEAEFYSSMRLAPVETRFSPPIKMEMAVRAGFRMDRKLKMYRDAFLESAGQLPVLALHPSPFLEIPAFEGECRGPALTVSCESTTHLPLDREFCRSLGDLRNGTRSPEERRSLLQPFFEFIRDPESLVNDTVLADHFERICRVPAGR